MTDLYEEGDRLAYAQNRLHEVLECLDEAAENLSLVEIPALPGRHPAYDISSSVSRTANSVRIIYNELDSLVSATLDAADYLGGLKSF